MNYLANIQKEVTPSDIIITSLNYETIRQDASNESVDTMPYFLGTLPITDLPPFHEQFVTTNLATTENKLEDDLWLMEVAQHVVASLGEYGFTLERLSQLIYVSPRQIRRRLKQLTGKTFSQYLKEARLQEAYRLLIKREIKTIKNLAYQVGLRDVKHFSKQFKAYYGDNPSAFLA